MLKVTIVLKDNSTKVFHKPNYYSDIIECVAIEIAMNFSKEVFGENVGHLKSLVIENTDFNRKMVLL